jgi:hypothetical protein
MDSETRNKSNCNASLTENGFVWQRRTFVSRSRRLPFSPCQTSPFRSDLLRTGVPSNAPVEVNNKIRGGNHE